ncbi:MAG: response regulator transcription factor [Alicyclobacillus mali]|uniref:response regulator n=1 Tax=Alicyclobacillus mali (ex Roth et al. 2021) TaxID=1123961 RepID=UPI0023F42F9D|nr:response regulator transcription factor [Alicyclobacillus mali (ex Roth et al. 2021)]MCL6487358.1 response regulator transcription factor [Alicyclobacillus mali (ex Roth et al. 2021)]
MIRVLIADDHPLVRLGMRSFLETQSDFEVVGEAVDGAEAVEQAERLRPDVVLLDLMMPGVSGLDATRVMKERGLPAEIVILTSSLDDERMVQALRAGAISYLLKTSPADEVARALREASLHRSVLDPQVQRRLVGELQAGRPGQRPGEDLTDRERDVLRGIAAGKSNQEIADELGIGVKTVKTHVSNILLKLDVLDRTQAAIFAIRHHLD